jgi:hypothetical protein
LLFAIRFKNYLEFLKMCPTRARSSTSSKESLARSWSPLVVGCIVGERQNHHLRLRAITEEYLPAYNSSKNNLENNALASEIVETIKSTPGKFLTKDCGVWVEVDDDLYRVAK